MTAHLVTFSDESMSRSAEVCVESARLNGVDMVWPYRDPLPADSRFLEVAEHWEVFGNPRGCGLWAWKPLLIREVMQNVEEGDTVIYADAGIEFLDNVNYIIDRMDQDIFLFGNQWEHAHWCKRDIVDAIFPPEVIPPIDNVTQGAKYKPWSDFGKQAQASVIFFRVTDHSRAFVAEWLKWCTAVSLKTNIGEHRARYYIDDTPSVAQNHPEFRENRHDQAILTTMAYRDGIKLHWWPAMYNDGAFVYERGDYPDEGIPVLFHHHRRRNSEWPTLAIAV